MKYVQVNEDKSVNWDSYFEYVQSEKENFSEYLFDYASDWKHYSLSDKESLHDAWLEGLLVKEYETPSGRVNDIRLVFLGPYHDRKFEFLYGAVSEYSLNKNAQSANGHGDVFIHEFRAEGDTFCHEIEFANGGTFRVVFKTFEYAETSL